MAKKPIRVNKKEKPVGTVAPEVYESNDSNKNEQQDLFSQSDPQSSTESPEEQKSNFSKTHTCDYHHDSFYNLGN